MSFAFGFGGDDIETGEQDVPMAEGAEVPVADSSTLIPPKALEYDAMLSALPSSLSYTRHSPLPPRRALYDIRAQLMTESDPGLADAIGLSADDISPGLYEGGFKTWECAADLAAFAPSFCGAAAGRHLHIVELGAGTAVPSCALLHRFLSRDAFGPTEGPQGSAAAPAASLRLTVADYNAPVLRLASAPNVFLAAADALGLLAPLAPDAQAAEADIEVSPALVRAVREGLRARRASVRCVEGAWGEGLVQEVEAGSEGEGQGGLTVVLASETIYAPGSLGVFAQTLLDLLRRAGERGEARALVAAKRVYFGVGGGVAEFVAEVERRGGKVEEVWGTKGAGVGRCILRVDAG